VDGIILSFKEFVKSFLKEFQKLLKFLQIS